MGKNSRTGCVYSARFGASRGGGRLLSTLTPDDRHKISTNHSRGPRGIPRNATRRKSVHNFVLLLKQTSPSSRKRTTMESTVALYKQLKTEWTKSPINLKLCGTILDKLKVALAGMSYIPTGNAQANQQELLIARDILEIGVEYSIATKNIPAFERYILQLKWFYYDYNTLIGESKNKYQLLGLNLLFLLSQNRVAEFHTELELLPADIIQTNAFIRHPLALEQYLMEGRYNKIFQAKGNVPAESYNFFIDILLQTVRNEIGACLESSYERISLQEAAKRLNLKSKEEVKQFGEKKAWKLSPDGFYHFVNELAKPKEPIPSQELAEQAIMYARELEMIV